MNPQSCVAPRVGDMDSRASVWPLELGIWTPTLRCGPSSWGYGLPRFSVAPQDLGYGLPHKGLFGGGKHYLYPPKPYQKNLPKVYQPPQSLSKSPPNLTTPQTLPKKPPNPRGRFFGKEKNGGRGCFGKKWSETGVPLVKKHGFFLVHTTQIVCVKRRGVSGCKCMNVCIGKGQC